MVNSLNPSLDLDYTNHYQQKYIVKRKVHMSKKVSRRYEEQAQEIRQRLGARPYSIGLDLGVGSIGIAVAAYDLKNKQPSDLVFVSSRIFTPSIGASERRQKRGQRNSLRHRANRLKFLWKLLAEKDLMLPYSEQDVPDPARLRFEDAVVRANPYVLRLKGLNEQLTLSELGYALYHIANHRGSSSVRTLLDEEKSPDDKKLEEQQAMTEQLAKEKGFSTFIEVLAEFNANGLVGYRNSDSLKGKGVPVPTRDIISNEIDILLRTQKQFYPHVLSDDYCERIVSAMLYENEKIVPEAGNCPYFPDEKKLPRCHFLNEERRLWEAINNARIKMPMQEGVAKRYQSESFSDEQRHILFHIARSGTDITPKLVQKEFPTLKTSIIVLQGKEKATQKIAGFRFRKLEEKPFWKRLNEEQKDDFFSAWTNTPDDKRLSNYLMENLLLSEAEVVDALKTVSLIGDYGPIGKTATQLLMKHLEDGLTYTEAIEKGLEDGELQELSAWQEHALLPYYGQILTGSTQALMGKYWHSAFKEKRDNEGFFKPNTNSEEEKYGRIANPVVHQTLNELRKLMNELITILGDKPKEITVELARELKVGADKREDIIKQQAKQEKEAARAFSEYCEPNNLDKRYIERFRLLEDQAFVCPYCLGHISVADIAENRVDVDHIFPRDDTADNSYGNKVVAHRHCNDIKGKRTPYAAFSNTSAWGPIMHYLDETPGMWKKRRKFETTEEEYAKYIQSKGFVSRFGSDNSYIAKAALEYLRCLFDSKNCSAVGSLKGMETSILRKAWNLQGVDDYLGSRHWSKNDEASPTSRKNRADNRHHGLDAIVALYCSRSLVQMINTMSEQGNRAVDIEAMIPIPGYALEPDLPVADQRDFFRKKILEFMELHAFVSMKTDNDVNGALLKDTVYSILGADLQGEDLVFVVKKKIKGVGVKIGDYEEVASTIRGRITEKQPKWYPEELKEKIKQLQAKNETALQKYKDSLVQAAAVLEESNRKLIESGKKPIQLSEKTISKKALELVGGYYYLISNNKRTKTFVVKDPSNEVKGFAFDTGSNLCLDFYHDAQGKLCGEIIRKVNAMNPSYEPAYKKQGYSLFVRLYQGDVCELRASDPTEADSNFAKTTQVHVPNAKQGRTLIVINTFTETLSGFQIFISNLAKSKRDKDASFSLTTIKNYDVRKVQLSSAGLVRYVSPLLVDKLEKDEVELCGE